MIAFYELAKFEKRIFQLSKFLVLVSIIISSQFILYPLNYYYCYQLNSHYIIQNIFKSHVMTVFSKKLLMIRFLISTKVDKCMLAISIILNSAKVYSRNSNLHILTN